MMNVAVIGAGRMGLTHIKNLAGISSVRVVVVADVNLEAAENTKNLARAEIATMSFAALESATPPSPGLQDALETLRLALAARQSWCEKRPVKVSEVV
jgi:predicted dehydrogenase